MYLSFRLSLYLSVSVLCVFCLFMIVCSYQVQAQNSEPDAKAHGACFTCTSFSRKNILLCCTINILLRENDSSTNIVGMLHIHHITTAAATVVAVAVAVAFSQISNRMKFICKKHRAAAAAVIVAACHWAHMYFNTVHYLVFNVCLSTTLTSMIGA